MKELAFSLRIIFRMMMRSSNPDDFPKQIRVPCDVKSSGGCGQSPNSSKAPSSQGSLASATPLGKRPLILVIEDDPGVMQVLLAILALRNLNVLTATTIPEALNHWDLHKHELNLVLSDKWLSEYENTDDLLDWFNAAHPALPVVLVTGSRLGWEAEQQGKARKKLLNKPFAVADLLEIVDFWTSNQSRDVEKVERMRE